MKNSSQNLFSLIRGACKKIFANSSGAQVHILTPFHRPENVPALVAHLEPMRVIWHPICDVQVDFDAPWIVPIFAVPPPEWDACYWKHNHWIATQPIVDTDWYGFMNDDDGYEPDVMDMIRSKTNSQLVVVSMKRGNRAPAGTGCPGTSTLLAKPEFMKECHVGVQQLFVRGSILRTMQFMNHYHADGFMMENLTQRFPTTYKPKFFAKFNILEPGRWDD